MRVKHAESCLKRGLPSCRRSLRRRTRLGARYIIASGLLVGAGAAPLAAQEDFRSLDRGRPTLVEDAFTLKHGEWEFQPGTRGAVADSGSGFLLMAELKSGLFLNGEVGIETAAGLQDPGGSGPTISGIESLGAHVIYNLSHQTWHLPATALRVDVMTPGTGDLGRAGWAAGLKGMATQSFKHLRAHLNAGYVVAAQADGGDFVQLGLALDHPLGLFSRMIVGDVYAELPTSAGRARVWLELGTRWQVGNNTVLDFGVATRLDRWDAGNANIELVLGLSQIFGIPGFVRVPSYPEPSIH